MASVIRGSDDFDSNTVGINLGTAVATTSGTSIDFTGIPVGVKRITVMFSGVSTNGTSIPQIQIGSGSVTTSGYSTASAITQGTVSTTAYTTGFAINSNGESATRDGTLVLTLLNNNTWTGSGTILGTNAIAMSIIAGASPALGGALDRVRITTVNGTDTFDAGSVNISWE